MSRWRLVTSHPRLLFALMLGIAVGLLLPRIPSPVARLLIGWNVGVWSYLLLVVWLMVRASTSEVRELAEQEDRNAISVVLLLSLGAVLSVVAIVVELATAKGLARSDRTWHYLLTGLTVFASWCLVSVVYTFHYAHLFYRSPPDKRALRFPNEEPWPDYWDFLYFSLTIAVGAQTSDVAVMSRTTRKAVIAQAVLSFFFNATIIGLSINLAAGLIGT